MIFPITDQSVIDGLSIVVMVIVVFMFGMFGLMYYRRMKGRKNNSAPEKITGDLKVAPSVNNDKKVNVCPACNSMDITSWNPVGMAGLQGPNSMVCRNCDYSGPMTVMLRDEAKKLVVGKKK